MLFSDRVAGIDLQSPSNIPKGLFRVVVLFLCYATIDVQVGIAMYSTNCGIVPVDCGGQVAELYLRKSDVVEEISFLRPLGSEDLTGTSGKSNCLKEDRSGLCLR